jgi:hypothetical protein
LNPAFGSPVTSEALHPIDAALIYGSIFDMIRYPLKAFAPRLDAVESPAAAIDMYDTVLARFQVAMATAPYIPSRTHASHLENGTGVTGNIAAPKLYPGPRSRTGIDDDGDGDGDGDDDGEALLSLSRRSSRFR